MSRYGKILLVLTSLQFIPIYVSSTKISYYEVLANGHVREKLKFVEPRVLFNNYNQSQISEVCAQALSDYEQGIHRQELWALQMLDSSSKISSGILWGNLIDLGMYDECTRASNTHFKNNGAIRGQHCMYSVNDMILSPEREFPFNPMLSICLPEKCNSVDLVGLINTSIGSSNKLMSLGLNVSYASCTKPVDLNIDKEFIVFLLIMGLYLGFLSMCTILDIWNSSYQSKIYNRTINNLIQFSYLKSTKAIFSMELNEGDLPAIHGLRAVNTFWLIIVHEYFFYILSPLNNFLQVAEWYTSWTFLIPMVGLYSVDTFFVLSGFLSSFAFFKKEQKNQSFNLLNFYLHRIMRLAPSVAAVLYITLVLLPKIPVLISGPRMDWLLNIFVSGCYSKWPSVLFFFQNLVQQDNYCLQQLWSVSVDVQFMLISPFIFYILEKTPKIGLSILVALFTASITSSAIIVGMNKYPAIYFAQDHSVATTIKVFEDVYEMPYTRASPWLLGIFLGYVIQKKSIKLKPMIYYLGWFLTAASFIFCVIGIKTFTNEKYEYNVYWEIVFASLAKPIWGLIICWIIYLAINCPNNLLNQLLSSKVFLPFSRISYFVCMTHGLFPLLQVGYMKIPRYFSDYLVLQSYIITVLMSNIFAVILSITFEIPIRNLVRMISRRGKVFNSNKPKKN